jgi:hypothetical protein
MSCSNTVAFPSSIVSIYDSAFLRCRSCTALKGVIDSWVHEQWSELQGSTIKSISNEGG